MDLPIYLKYTSIDDPFGMCSDWSSEEGYSGGYEEVESPVSPPEIVHGGDDALIRRKRRDNWLKQVGVKLLGHLRSATTSDSDNGSGSGYEEIMMTPTTAKTVRFTAAPAVAAEAYNHESGILKNKRNDNWDEEKSRMDKSDQVAVNEFVATLAQKQVRRRQMSRYFDNVRQSQLCRANSD